MANATHLDIAASNDDAVGGARRRSPWRWLVLALVTLLLLLTLFPFFLAVVNAVKSAADYALGGPLSIPSAADFSSLVRFWNLADFSRKLLNSAIISIAVAIFGVLISLLNAYAIGIGRVKARGCSW